LNNQKIKVEQVFKYEKIGEKGWASGLIRLSGIFLSIKEGTIELSVLLD